MAYTEILLRTEGFFFVNCRVAWCYTESLNVVLGAGSSVFYF